MKILTFKGDNQQRLGLLRDDWVIDLALTYQCLEGSEQRIPQDMIALLEEGLDQVRVVHRASEDIAVLRAKIPSAFLSLEEVKLLAPLPRTRKNIVCLGLNYVDHAEETNTPIPTAPVFFTKAPTSIIGPNDSIILPKHSIEIDYEVELAIIIGKKGKNISPEEAFDYLCGYTVFNDVTARDMQRNHLQWFKGKSLDTFAPIGPYLVTKDEVPNPHDLDVTLKVNGRVMQQSNTQNMLFPIPTIIEILSKDMTLEPGDIIATGTPAGVGFTRSPPTFLQAGDVVEASIEKIGVLRNTVVSL
jgi:2-keto-4-pentenoate hydratase/2-oxohepta-3-ene-1,7-dioic acid hydratase in catechol pathway